MKMRKINENVSWLGVVDWNRRLFDALIPLPDGTSYNAYLVRGADQTALIDTVDPLSSDILMCQLEDVESLDYIISLHAEQDHSGSIAMVMEKYPQAKVITSAKGKGLLIDHLCLAEESIVTVADSETLDLGGKTLEFIYTPWVHWPETMCAYLQEDKILFSCDFMGSHLATSDLYASNQGEAYEAAKRYYAEIMMPFRPIIRKNLEKITAREISIIAPSHGPLFDKPEWILDAYADWVSDNVKNEVVIPYISMHGSTQIMVDYLVSALVEHGVKVRIFDLSVTDIGKLAIALVDAATIVVGTPTVHVGAHPVVFYAAHLANALRPKLRYASVINSYGWSSKAVERIAEAIPSLKVEIIDPVLARGVPGEESFAALDQLAETIAAKHKAL